MKSHLFQTIKAIALALALSFGINLVSANWTPAPPVTPPGTNSTPPLDVGSTAQIKTGALQVNATTRNASVVAVDINNSLRASSAIPDAARIYVDETGDSATGGWSGLELRKNGIFYGGIFKKGDPTAANNDIAIWNGNKPVLTVKQNNVTEFAGQIKIAGGSPGSGKVLTATDSLGNATWQTPTGGTGTVVLAATTTYTVHNVENTFFGDGVTGSTRPATAGEISTASCPGANQAMVGFYFGQVGDTMSENGINNPIYCR